MVNLCEREVRTLSDSRFDSSHYPNDFSLFNFSCFLSDWIFHFTNSPKQFNPIYSKGKDQEQTLSSVMLTEFLLLTGLLTEVGRFRL